MPEGVNEQESDDQQRNHGQPSIGEQPRGRKEGVGIAHLDDEQRGHTQHDGQAFQAQMRVHDLLVPEPGIVAPLPGEPLLQEEQKTQQRCSEHEQHKEQMQAETDEKQAVLPGFRQGHSEKKIVPFSHVYFSLGSS